MSTPNIPADVKTEIMFRNQFEMWRNVYRDLGETPTLCCIAEGLVKRYPALADHVHTVQGLNYLNVRFDDEALIHLEYYTDHLLINAIGMADYMAIEIPYTAILGVRSMDEVFVHRVDASLAMFPSADYHDRPFVVFGHQFVEQPVIEEKIVPPERPRPVLKLVQ